MVALEARCQRTHATGMLRIMVVISVVVLLLAYTLVLAQPGILSGFAGFGGYISEKLLGDGTNEVLYLGDGTNELSVLGSCPVVSTAGATSYSSGNIVTMTMTGNLQTLNGLPQASVWFQWGYSPSTMVFVTTSNIVTTTGAYTNTCNPSAGKTVYYKARASTDGSASGDTLFLSVVGGGHGVGYWLMNTLLPIIIASIILISVLLLTHSLILALVSSVIGLAGFYIILAMVTSI